VADDDRQPEVHDDPEHHRFVLSDEGSEAQLVYRLDGDRLVLEHTEVPEELGGRGLGGVLVRAALERAVADHLTIAPWCPFARRWLERHPDDSAAATIDWSSPPAGSD
jgi:predicted GNAT family acetyltransferase